MSSCSILDSIEIENSLSFEINVQLNAADASKIEAGSTQSLTIPVATGVYLNVKTEYQRCTYDITITIPRSHTKFNVIPFKDKLFKLFLGGFEVVPYQCT